MKQKTNMATPKRAAIAPIPTPTMPPTDMWDEVGELTLAAGSVDNKTASVVVMFQAMTVVWLWPKITVRVTGSVVVIVVVITPRTGIEAVLGPKSLAISPVRVGRC
jgi:hypothetical protein